MINKELRAELNSILSAGFMRIKRIYRKNDSKMEIEKEINRISTTILRRIFDKKKNIIAFIFDVPMVCLKGFYHFLFGELKKPYSTQAILRTILKITLSCFLICIPFIFSLGSFSPIVSVFLLIMVIGFAMQSRIKY